MIRFVGLLARKAMGFVTRRILRDALASAIVTIIVTAAFTGFATRSEPPLPPAVYAAAAPTSAPATVATPAAARVATPDGMQDAMRVWLDPNSVTPDPKGFQRRAAAARAAPRKRNVAALRASPSPLPRLTAPAGPRAVPLVLANLRADEKAIGHRRAPDALASAAPVAEKRGFRVWGVAPADLIPSVPSASSIVKGVRSVGSSVVSWIPSL